MSQPINNQLGQSIIFSFSDGFQEIGYQEGIRAPEEMKRLNQNQMQGVVQLTNPRLFKVMKNYILVFASFFVLGLSANAQVWNNLVQNANQPGLEENPLKGFASMWQPSNTFPHSIQGKLFGLDEIMFGPNTFDWAVVDTFLAQEASKGNHCYLQVNIDPAFGGSDMPGFLVNQVDWEVYTNPPVPDSCPDWNDPDLMSAMLTFIDSFGTRYNNDPRIFMIHLGLYGLWGEWHIGDVENVRPEFAMTEPNKTLIANAYLDAFPDVHLLARYAENMPDPQAFGYSDGLFFGQSISNTNSYYFHNTLKNYAADLNWKNHPIGGELDPALQNTIWQAFPNVVGQDVYDCLDSIRPTWIFAHYNLTNLPSGTVEWDNAIRAQKAMGYTFYLDQYRLSASGGKPAVEVNLQNTGLAPMYANWDVELGVLDVNSQFQSLGITKWNLDLIQPDVANNYRSFVSDSILPDGDYTFLLRVINPLEAFSPDAKPLRFANTTQDADLTGWITLGDTTITLGNVGVIPIAVTGMSVTPTSATVEVGDLLQLAALVVPVNATNPDVTWISDHPSTASVSTNGLVIAGPSTGIVIVSAYTHDGGFIGQCVITVEPKLVPIPALIEAEEFLDMAGIVVEPCGEGGENLGFIDTGDWMEYGVFVDSAATFLVDFRVASQSHTSKIAIVDENNDTLDILLVPFTGAWQTYQTITGNSIALATGGHMLRIVALEGGFNLNWIEFYFDELLPVEFVSFTATPKEDHIALAWTTDLEINNQGFFLERRTNTDAFTTISWIQANNTTDARHRYDYQDAEVEKNTDYYYRLVQQDLDGSHAYSEIVSARLDEDGFDYASLITVYPNPTKHTISIDWGSNELDIPLSSIKLINTIGAEVTPPISNDMTIDLSSLPVGVYYLMVNVNGERVVKKVVKY